MALGFEFQPSYLTDNLLAILYKTDADAFLNLKKKGYINLPRYEYTPTLNSLRLQCVDKYITAAKADPRDVFFRTEEDRQPAYTQYDSLVVAILDALQPHQLDALDKWLDLRYPNRLYRLDNPRPGHRLLACFKGTPRGTVSEQAIEELPPWKRVSGELGLDIRRFTVEHRWNPNHTFTTSLWLDWASFAGVSIHWIFRLSQPLYCRTQQADLIFDKYTLMAEQDQESFLSVLSVLFAGLFEPILSAIKEKNSKFSYYHKTILPAFYHDSWQSRDLVNNQSKDSQKIPSVIADIPQCTLANMCKWLDNSKQVLKEIEQIVSQIADKPEDRTVSSVNSFYADRFLSAEPSREGSNFLLNDIAFCASRYQGISCHQILFGEHKSIELFGQDRFFIEAMNALGNSERTEILKRLGCFEPYVNNPNYLVKTRFQSLSNYQHYQFRSFLISCCSLSLHSASIRRNMICDVSPVVDYRKTSFSTSTAIFLLPVMAAAFFDVSADYFMLPDYSSVATRNGNLLSEEEKMWLAAFLALSFSAREEILRQIWSYLFDISK